MAEVVVGNRVGHPAQVRVQHIENRRQLIEGHIGTRLTERIEVGGAQRPNRVSDGPLLAGR